LRKRSGPERDRKDRTVEIILWRGCHALVGRGRRSRYCGIDRERKGDIDEKERDPQPMTDYDYVMGPKYSLMRCYNYGKEGRVLGGFDLARLVKEPVSFSLRQGSPQFVISACVVTQIYRPSKAAGPADGNNRHQNDDDEQFVPSPPFEWNCCSGRIRSAHHSRIKSFPVVKHTPCLLAL